MAVVAERVAKASDSELMVCGGRLLVEFWYC